MEIMENHKIVFSSKTENIVFVEKMVEEICEEFKISEDNFGNILVAITEAVNNAIQHGNKLNPNKSIDITFEQQEQALRFRVKDEGDGFDFSNIPDPTDPENIEKPHGRGIFLMKHLADHVDFLENGRIVELSFRVCNN
jgi:serine/threonine-protein kinase RsbW